MIDLKPGWTYVSQNGNVRRTIISVDGDRVTWCNNSWRASFAFHESTRAGFLRWLSVERTHLLHMMVIVHQFEKLAA